MKCNCLNIYILVNLIVVYLHVVPSLRAATNFIENPSITNYNPDSYKAARQNWSVTQDDDGIMYFANMHGLIEYDGLKWTKHTSAVINEMRTVAFDPISKRLYCGTYEEFGYWTCDETGTLNYYSISDSLGSDSFHNDEIWSIHFFNDTVLFRSFGTYFLFTGGKIISKTFPASCLSVNYIHGQLYASTTKGLCRYDKGTFSLLENSSQFTGNKEIVALLEYDRERMVCATRNDGLWFYNGNKFSKWKTQADNRFYLSNLNRALAVNDSMYVFGTILDGIIAIDNNGELLWHLNKQGGLQNNTVLGLHLDREGNLWTALDTGIDKIELNNSIGFYHGLFDNVEAVYAIIEFDNAVYIGTNKGLFRRKNGETGFKLVAGTQGQVWSLSVFDGQLLCGHNNGTFRIEGTNTIQLSDITGGYGIKKVLLNNEELLLQSTYTRMAVYKKDRKGMWQFSHAISGFVEPIRYIQTDPHGNIWAAHDKRNFFKIRLNKSLTAIENIKRFKTIGNYPAVKTGIFKINNQIIFTSGRELFIYDDINDTIVPYDRMNKRLGMAAQAHKIIDVRDNKYWFALHDRLIKIELHNDTCKELAIITNKELKNNLMPMLECIYQSDKGITYIGLNNGFAVSDDSKRILSGGRPPGGVRVGGGGGVGGGGVG
ncbi:MAG: hypothetical protein LBR67_06990, partial [Dysgonamonadaceae bacterium]|nr:hypothetical protein [Dysgonamonadaceae bacterium]